MLQELALQANGDTIKNRVLDKSEAFMDGHLHLVAASALENNPGNRISDALSN